MYKSLFKVAGLTAIFLSLSACVDSPETAESNEVTADQVVEVTSKRASTIDAKTQIGTNYLYEITPAESPNRTCFMLSSIYSGNAVSGDVECVEGDNLDYRDSGRKVEILSSTRIGTNNFYELIPATRPDLICYASSTKYTGNAISGSVNCMKNNLL